ncbi:MAG: enoyl-CoA hydratase/isomerase family protein [Bdellovibrionales bacterium]
MQSEFKTIKLSQQNALWTLAIARPESLNALNQNVLSEMAVALRLIGEMKFEDARGLIVTGEGEKAFVAGADIKEMLNLKSPEAAQFAKKGQSVFHELELLKIPVLASVNGFALGGGLELALACDFIFASENAKLGLPEVSLGLIPGFGGTLRLARAVGLRRARELIFSGDVITAQEALSFGLVNRVVPKAELMAQAIARLEFITARGPLAVAQSKKALLANWDLDIEMAQKFEAELFSELFDSQDAAEGMKAFTEKRKAQFRGI